MIFKAERPRLLSRCFYMLYRRIRSRLRAAKRIGRGLRPCSRVGAKNSTLTITGYFRSTLREIDLDEGIAGMLDALHADRLGILCGAGLSMASPSNLPSAAQIASEAKRKYDATYGATRPPLPSGIEEQAEFFFQRGELGTVFLRTLVDQHAFAGHPNAGHTAVADLLLVRAIQTGVSTNVDTLIETAGVLLFGRVGAGIDRAAVAALPPDTSPLLKIHGCWSNPDTTVWTPGQLAVEPVMSRIQGNKEWLGNRLLDRDLIIVGYFTDWDYLNETLEQTLGEVRPARVMIVDPSPGATLAAKAPVLHALGGRSRIQFLPCPHFRRRFSGAVEAGIFASVRAACAARW